MMYPEHQLLPISALQHLLFCERQCALIHLEQVWAENHLTIQGEHLHKKAHEGKHESVHGVRVTRGLPLRSLRLGLIGKADIVEFDKAQRSEVRGQSDSTLRVTPVEYKRGWPKKDDSDRVQLCAQALCLEEMLDASIAYGEIFYGRQRRRVQVEFDARLRELTEATTAKLHQLIDSRVTPVARFEPKCESCSLIELCMPRTVGLHRSAQRVVDKYFTTHVRGNGPLSDETSSDEICIP